MEDHARDERKQARGDRVRQTDPLRSIPDGTSAPGPSETWARQSRGSALEPRRLTGNDQRNRTIPSIASDEVSNRLTPRDSFSMRSRGRISISGKHRAGNCGGNEDSAKDGFVPGLSGYMPAAHAMARSVIDSTLRERNGSGSSIGMEKSRDGLAAPVGFPARPRCVHDPSFRPLALLGHMLGDPLKFLSHALPAVAGILRGSGGGVAMPGDAAPAPARHHIPATRSATIESSSVEKTDMLCCTCSAPKTASTISCTLWYRSLGSLAIARLIAVANGSGLSRCSGVAASAERFAGEVLTHRRDSGCASELSEPFATRDQSARCQGSQRRYHSVQEMVEAVSAPSTCAEHVCLSTEELSMVPSASPGMWWPVRAREQHHLALRHRRRLPRQDPSDRWERVAQKLRGSASIMARRASG